MIGTTVAVVAFYGRLHNDGRPRVVVGDFASTALVTRSSTDLHVCGPRLAAEMLYNWRLSFELLQVGRPTVEVMDCLVQDVPGSMHCFIARTPAMGAYTRTVPGLERKARAHGSRSHFHVNDTIWVDRLGKIVRVINAFEVAALKLV